MKARHQSAQSFSRWLVRSGCLFCVTVFLTSCSERAQEMEEKVTQLQRQLDQTQKQLQAANQALASRKDEEPVKTPATETSSGLPSREALEQSYSARVSTFRKELDASLKDFRIESFTVHSVQMPEEFYPFTSQLSLSLVSTEGKNFTTDIPVKADATGKWIFPTVAEVTQRVEAARQSASGVVAPSTSTAQRQTGATSEQPAPIMKVDGTFVIQWPNANAPGPSSRAPAPAQSTPAPATSLPATPPPVTAASPPPRAQPSPTAAQVMPVDRDVQIQFPTPP